MPWRGFSKAGSKSRPVEVAVVNLDRGGLGREIISDLKGVEGIVLLETVNGLPLTQEKAEELIRQGKFPLALLIPERFSERTMALSMDPAQKGSGDLHS